MNKRRIISVAVVLCTILMNFLIIKYACIGKASEYAYSISFDLSMTKADDIKLYSAYNGEFSEQSVQTVHYERANQVQNITFKIERKYDDYRLDMLAQEGVANISNVVVHSDFGNKAYSVDTLLDEQKRNDISSVVMNANNAEIVSSGNDAYICLKNIEEMGDFIQKPMDKISFVLDLILCILLDLIVISMLLHMQESIEIPLEIVRNRKLVWNLSKNDFKTRFAGSYLGIIWAFVQPVVTILVYWFVFEKGLRAGKMCDYPYILWFMTGLIPWFYFSEALNGGTNSLVEYNYLVKKVVFKISILPMVKTTSALFVHLFFIAFNVTLASFYGFVPDLYTLQLLYYVLCTFLLVLGLSYFTSAVVVFFRDLGQIINIILQVGMWITPIMWDASAMLSYKWAMVFRLNPVYYVVDGFRNCVLDKVWFWEKPLWTAYYWVLIIGVFMLGTKVFRRLKVHFADVL